MQLPSNLSVAAGTIATSATPNQLTATTVINAPGAGLRIRVWAWSVANRQDQAYVMQLRLRPAGSNTILAVAATNTDGAPSVHCELPGGLLLDDNTGLALAHAATVASRVFEYAVYWTEELA